MYFNYRVGHVFRFHYFEIYRRAKLVLGNNDEYSKKPPPLYTNSGGGFKLRVVLTEIIGVRPNYLVYLHS